MGKSFWLLVCVAVIITLCESATLPPTTSQETTDQAFIITTVQTPTEELEDDFGGTVSSEAEVEPSAPVLKDARVGAPQSPEIYSFHIDSHIRYRYSRTYVTSRVANKDAQKSQEAVFKVVLPETAFISKFVMDIDGKSYEAYVKEKEVAKNIYNQAQSQGQSAGLVEVNTRNANVFNVNVNVKAGSKVNFNLTYEELLSRRLGRYEQSINIIPDQIMNVNDFQVTVNIEESQNITTLRVPQLRNDVEAETDAAGNNPDAIIERVAGNKANITWKPSKKDQAALTTQGATGKFIVQYDIKRELDAGEVLIMNGYFVHFFAPDNLPPLRKHVVFILDVSGSMWGTRIEQLKESMTKILADMNTEDFFNIITFSSDVNLWGLDDKVTATPDNYWSHVAHMEDTARLKAEEEAKKYPIAASKANIEKAQKYINSLVAQGGTNIHGSIIKALNLTTHIKNARKVNLEGATTVSSASSTESTPTTTVAEPLATETSTGSSNNTATSSAPIALALKSKQLPVLPPGVESLILFLTDGEPTVGETNPTTIQTLIKQANANESVPIFSLAFGEGADFPFVRKLSLQNNGFARKIYEAADTTLQLKGFYNEIASPLLSNVKFNYTSPIGEISNLTITKYPTVFGGTEIAICGTFTPRPNENDTVDPADIESVNVTTPSSSSTEKIARLEDSVALPHGSGFTHGEPCSYNEDFGFDVSVTGNGRDGNSMELRRPCIWSNPIPWGLPVVRPWPPRPTPPPTLEDTFLEKMWAYLTIKQLIDKDLATIGDAPTIDMDNDIFSEEKTTDTTVETTTVAVSKLTISNTTAVANKTVETPKQKALRIALKYSFVTPLTSLVVVKPNSTDIENTRPADGSSQTAIDSQAVAFGGASPFALSAGLRSGPGGYGGALALAHSVPQRPSSYYATRGIGHAPAVGYAPMPIYSAGAPLPDSVYYDTMPGEDYAAPESLPVPSSTPPLQLSTTLNPTTTTGTPALTLRDMTWYLQATNVTEDGKMRITINGTSYLMATEEATVEPSLSQECVVEGRNETGVCVHVKDCVQSAFLNDFKVYEESYFCQIPSGTENYAGACCPDQKRKIVVP